MNYKLYNLLLCCSLFFIIHSCKKKYNKTNISSEINLSDLTVEKNANFLELLDSVKFVIINKPFKRIKKIVKVSMNEFLILDNGILYLTNDSICHPVVSIGDAPDQIRRVEDFYFQQNKIYIIDQFKPFLIVTDLIGKWIQKISLVDSIKNKWTPSKIAIIRDQIIIFNSDANNIFSKFNFAKVSSDQIIAFNPIPHQFGINLQEFADLMVIDSQLVYSEIFENSIIKLCLDSLYFTPYYKIVFDKNDSILRSGILDKMHQGVRGSELFDLIMNKTSNLIDYKETKSVRYYLLRQYDLNRMVHILSLYQSKSIKTIRLIESFNAMLSDCFIVNNWKSSDDNYLYSDLNENEIFNFQNCRKFKRNHFSQIRNNVFKHQYDFLDSIDGSKSTVIVQARFNSR